MSKEVKNLQTKFIPANVKNKKILPIKNTPKDVLAYMPKRNEFEFEYDNDAEQIIAELTFGENESSSDLELKYKILDIYNDRLDER